MHKIQLYYWPTHDLKARKELQFDFFQVSKVGWIMVLTWFKHSSLIIRKFCNLSKTYLIRIFCRGITPKYFRRWSECLLLSLCIFLTINFELRLIAIAKVFTLVQFSIKITDLIPCFLTNECYPRFIQYNLSRHFCVYWNLNRDWWQKRKTVCHAFLTRAKKVNIKIRNSSKVIIIKYIKKEQAWYGLFITYEII